MFNELENKLIDLNVEFLANIVKKKAQKLVGVLNKQGGNFHKFAKVHAKHILDEFIQAPEVVHFKKNTKKCWDFMKRQRSSALCSTCSGRSSIFFDHGKNLVSPDKCAEAITNCCSFFQSIRIIVKLLNQVNPILLNHKEEHNYIEINFFLKLLEASGPPDQLIKGFVDYAVATQNNSTTSNLARQAESTTCSMILNIMKTPYVMAINPVNVAQVGKALVAHLKMKKKRVIDDLRSQKITLKKAMQSERRAVNQLDISKDDQAEKKVQIEREYSLKCNEIVEKIKEIEQEIKNTHQKQKTKASEASNAWNNHTHQMREKIKSEAVKEFAIIREAKIAAKKASQKPKPDDSPRNYSVLRNKGLSLTTKEQVFVSDSKMFIGIKVQLENRFGVTVVENHCNKQPYNENEKFP